MNHRYAQPLTLVLAASLLLTGCSEKPRSQTAAPATESVTAQVVTANPETIAITTDTPASVVAEEQTQIASRITGFIRAINVDVGQRVAAGQRLLTIDPTDIQGQVELSKANLAQADATLADARNDYERFGELYREQAIPKAQWDKVRLQYALAQQQVAAAKAGSSTAGEQMRYASLSAPFAGIITEKLANVGDLAAPGRPLLVLENPDKLQVQAQVSSDVFSHLQIGTPVSLRVDNPETFLTGKVDHLVPASDPVSHTYLVKIALPPHNTLKSGMYVQAGFATGTRLGLRLPVSAVLQRAGITGVFVLDSQNIAHYRMVRTGESADGLIEIQAGLNPGDRVVSSPTASLQSGDKVISAEAGHV